MAKKVTMTKEFFDVVTDNDPLDAWGVLMAIWKWAFDEEEHEPPNDKLVYSIMQLGIATGHLSKED